MKPDFFILLVVFLITVTMLPGCVTPGGGDTPATRATTLSVSATSPPTPSAEITTTLPPATTVLIATTVTENPDGAFHAAAEKCLNETPEIINLTTEMAFITCFQKTPMPASACARAYKQNVLKYTNDDTTTAGFTRMNENVQLLRKRYYEGLRYDTTLGGWVACEGGFFVATYEMEHN